MAFSLKSLFAGFLMGAVMLCTLIATANDEPFDNAAPPEQDLEVMAFVGEKVSFENKNIYRTREVTLPDGTIEKRKIANFNQRYEARYKVLEWIHGEIDKDIIDFEVYDHYGHPILPNFKTPMIFLVNYEGKWIQSKYNNYFLARTTDGDWATCGNPSRHERTKNQGERYLQPLAFVREIKNINGEICKSGTRAKDIFNYQNETRFLPDKWNVACNLELGLPRNIIAGTGSAPNAEELGRKHKACVERLKFEETGQ